MLSSRPLPGTAARPALSVAPSLPGVRGYEPVAVARHWLMVLGVIGQLTLDSLTIRPRGVQDEAQVDVIDMAARRAPIR